MYVGGGGLDHVCREGVYIMYVGGGGLYHVCRGGGLHHVCYSNKTIYM